MGLTVAVAGKGGTGKTTLAALLCRGLLDRGLKPLLAVDADPNSCLAERLGVRVDHTIGQLREELRNEPEKVPAGISKSEWVERLINQEVAEASGFDLVVMGRQEGPDCYCYINNMLRSCLAKLGQQYQGVLIDNEAGLEHLSRRTNGKVDVMLVVSQATVSGARTAVRITELMHSLELEIGAAYGVLNQSDGVLPDALAREFAKTGLEILGAIPADPLIPEFEIEQKSLMNLPAGCPSVVAVDGVLDALLTRRTKA